MDKVARKLEALRVDDYVSLVFSSREIRSKFYNSKLAVLEEVAETWVQAYVRRDGRRAVSSTSNISEAALDRLASFLDNVLDTSKETSHAPLPGPSKYEHNGDFDEKTLDYEVSPIVEAAINSALDSGAKRVAGVLKMGILEVSIATSTGVRATDKRSYSLLNVRALRNGEASGQGISVATSPARLDPVSAGRKAGEYSVMAENSCSIEEGVYDVVFTPTVTADIIQHLGWAASAYAVLSGFSFLESLLGEKAVSGKLSVIDHGQIKDGVNSRMFDDEGAPTKSKHIIDRGVVTSFLHNVTTASEMGRETTGNAGLIEPRPWNLEVLPGDSSLDEMLKELKRGLLVTSNWYTRFQNYKSGDYSTLPRDATPVIVDGEIRCSARGIRISSNMLRDLRSIKLVSKEREWIKWWEVETPVLAPYIMVEGVRVTKPW